MADAQRVYDEGVDDSRRRNLGLIWPDLAAALEAARAREHRTDATICAIGVHPAPAEATARLTLNGHPACAECLKRSDRPGGYPLQRQDPKGWR